MNNRENLAELDFAPSAELLDLIREVQAMEQRHLRLDWGVLVAALPAALLSYGIVLLDPRDRSKWQSTPMADEWVARAASLTTAASTSLKTLYRDMKQCGYVSIKAADHFCCIELARERECRQREQQCTALKAQLPNRGELLLEARVQSFGIDVTLEEAISAGRDYLKGLSTIAAGAATVIGKGVNLAAGALKDLGRTPSAADRDSR